MQRHVHRARTIPATALVVVLAALVGCSSDSTASTEFCNGLVELNTRTDALVAAATQDSRAQAWTDARRQLKRAETRVEELADKQGGSLGNDLEKAAESFEDSLDDIDARQSVESRTADVERAATTFRGELATIAKDGKCDASVTDKLD